MEDHQNMNSNKHITLVSPHKFPFFVCSYSWFGIISISWNHTASIRMCSGFVQVSWKFSPPYWQQACLDQLVKTLVLNYPEWHVLPEHLVICSGTLMTHKLHYVTFSNQRHLLLLHCCRTQFNKNKAKTRCFLITVNLCGVIYSGFVWGQLPTISIKFYIRL